jgi:hypothetical protein
MIITTGWGSIWTKPWEISMTSINSFHLIGASQAGKFEWGGHCFAFSSGGMNVLSANTRKVENQLQTPSYPRELKRLRKRSFGQCIRRLFIQRARGRAEATPCSIWGSTGCTPGWGKCGDRKFKLETEIIARTLVHFGRCQLKNKLVCRVKLL